MPPKDVEAAGSELQLYIIDIFRKGTGYRWGIMLKGQTRLIGTCSFYVRDKEAGKAQIGYDLDLEFRWRGIMKAALTEMFRFGLEHWTAVRC